MEIEFQGKTWTLTAADEYASPRGPVAQLTLEAVREAEKAHEERRHLDCVNWTHTANWLLRDYWDTGSEEEPAAARGA
ncbi:hypothetical protein [Streptomyces sp. NPDC057623]|uniref:hypothetical protein n=1 Tax=Streptomyces sp. NPDC057623 TaxID=3346187 RepID=UPI0036A311A6